MPKLAKELGALAVSRISDPGLHFVGGVQGLAMQVTAGTGRSWVLRAVIGGHRRDMGLGAYPDVTLAVARDKARDARELIRQGIDPIDRQRAAKSALRASVASAITFRACAEAYVDVHEAGWRNAKHAQQWRNTLAQYAYPVIGDLLVRDVTKELVLEVLRPIWKKKTETASRLRGRMELVLSYAMQAGYRPEGLNPARWRGGLDKLLPAPYKIKGEEHHVAVPVNEVGAFMKRLREAEGMGARALEFTILTAARSGEVRGATRDELDLEAGVWIIPAERMKAGREHRIPLSEAALNLLKSLPVIAESNTVFTAPRGGALSDMTLTAVMRRMGMKAVPHGFRSTFRDWAAERTNYPREVAEMALAHTIGNKVEAAYRRGDLFEKRRLMMADWANFLAQPQAQAAVLDLAGKRRKVSAALA